MASPGSRMLCNPTHFTTNEKSIAMSVEVGSVAPDFTLPDSNRTPVALSDFRGDRALPLRLGRAAGFLPGRLLRRLHGRVVRGARRPEFVPERASVGAGLSDRSAS